MTRPNDPNAVMLGANALLQTYRTISAIEYTIEHGESLDAYLPAILSLASLLRLVGCTLLSLIPDAPAQAIQNAQDELKRIGPEPRALISECLWTLLNAVRLLPTEPTAGADLLVFLGFALAQLSGSEAELHVPTPSLFRFQPLAPTDRLLYQTLYACACALLPPTTEATAVPDIQAWTDLRLLWQNMRAAFPDSLAVTLTPTQQQQTQSIRFHLSTRTAPAQAAVEFVRHLNDADWKRDPFIRFWGDAMVQVLDALRLQAPTSTTFKFFPSMSGGRT
ncbi:hypothetical protein [Deinococcus sp. UYEF24]